jgi:hypothetical protein
VQIATTPSGHADRTWCDAAGWLGCVGFGPFTGANVVGFGPLTGLNVVGFGPLTGLSVVGFDLAGATTLTADG